MTYLDVAYKILSEAHQPLHYSEIARRALDQNLIQPTGLTPDATMASRLYTDTQEEDSRFIRAGKGWFELAKQRPGGIEDQVQQINQRTRQQLQELLLAMPAKRFEALIMELLLKMGFDESTLQVTPYSGDGGIDVVGVYRADGLTEVVAAVQAKRWKGNVGAPTVTQLRGSLQVHQQGIIITTGGFSSGARKEAVAQGKTRIALIDGPQLVEMLIRNRVGAYEKRLIVDALDEEWWGELLNAQAAPPPQVAPPVVSAPAAVVTPPVAAATTALSVPVAVTAPPAVAPPAETAQPELIAVTVAAAENGGGDTPTGRKPVAVTLLNRREPVKSWKELLVVVCTRLAEKHPDTFEAIATAAHGRKRHYIAGTSNGMHTPKAIPGTSLYVETNLNAVIIVQLADHLVSEFGYPADSLSVELA